MPESIIHRIRRDFSRSFCIQSTEEEELITLFGRNKISKKYSLYIFKVIGPYILLGRKAKALKLWDCYVANHGNVS